MSSPAGPPATIFANASRSIFARSPNRVCVTVRAEMSVDLAVADSVKTRKTASRVIRGLRDANGGGPGYLTDEHHEHEQMFQKQLGPSGRKMIAKATA